MSLSLNEVEALARKAVRGAGYPWGLAEDGARAARWLVAHQVDGCAHLASTLALLDGMNDAQRRPLPGRAGWFGAGHRLCPITTGLALADGAIAVSAPVRLCNVVEPALLLAFLGLLADEGAVEMLWSGSRAVAGPSGVAGALPPVETLSDLVVLRTPSTPPTRPVVTRARLRRVDLMRLEALAHRTYAPATEQSRLLGAGAGLTDS